MLTGCSHCDVVVEIGVAALIGVPDTAVVITVVADELVLVLLQLLVYLLIQLS